MNKNIRITVKILSVMLLSLTMFIACDSSTNNNYNAPVNEGSLDLLEVYSEEGYFQSHIVGTIKNNTIHDYTYVSVHINFYTENYLVAYHTIMAETDNLRVGKIIIYLLPTAIILPFCSAFSF